MGETNPSLLGRVVGIRGAITIAENSSNAIRKGAADLIAAMAEANAVEAEQVAACFLTVTDDLNASFPAEGVRSLDGWSSVPLMCAREIPVPGSLPRCLRALLLVNWASDKMIPQPVYLGEAIRLRPDLRERPTRTGA